MVADAFHGFVSICENGPCFANVVHALFICFFFCAVEFVSFGYWPVFLQPVCINPINLFIIALLQQRRKHLQYLFARIAFEGESLLFNIEPLA